MLRNLYICATVILLWSSPVSLSRAQTDTETDTEPQDWQASILLGFNFTDGNTDTSLLNFGAKAAHEKGNDIWRFEADHSVGEEDDETNIDSTDALAEYKHLLNDRLYLGLGSTFRRDEIADVKYRLSVNPAAGYFLVKSDSTQFNLEIGPSYIFEEVGGKSDDYFAPRIKQRLSYQLSETAKLFEEMAITFDINDSDNYLIEASAGVEVALVSKLSLVLSVQDIYDNQPADGLEKNDLQVLTSLAYQLTVDG